jgi:hypothetical protein
MISRTALLIGAICAFALSPALAQDEAKPQETPKPPPELTLVSGRIVYSAEEPTTGGLAYFVFQRRLIEIPQEESIEKVRAMAENIAALDEEGSFTLDMAPGNYALFYDPKWAEASENAMKPGPESFAVAKKLTPEQQRARIEVIKQNAEKGLPIENGKMGDLYVIENRFVRPPVVEFGEMELGADHSVTVLAVKENGSAVDFPLALRLRGKNGDIIEPHPPSTSEAGKFVFHDVFPQQYDAFAIGQRPRPGEGDEVTTPTLKNNVFLFEGTPKEIRITITPGTKNDAQRPRAEPSPAARTRRSR